MTLGVDSNVHVANHTLNDIHVLPLPGSAWVLADVFVDSAIVAGLLAISGGSAAPVAGATVGQLMAALGGGGTMYTLASAIKRNAITIAPRADANVFDRTRFGPTYIASSIAGMLGAETVNLLIITDDEQRSASFGTNPDHSWIATEAGVVRARYGTVNDLDPESGSHAWTVHPAGGDQAEGDSAGALPAEAENV